MLIGNYQDMSNLPRQIWQPLVQSFACFFCITPQSPSQGNINANYSSFPKLFTHRAPQGSYPPLRESPLWLFTHPLSAFAIISPLSSLIFGSPGDLCSNLQITRIPLGSHTAPRWARESGTAVSGRRLARQGEPKVWGADKEHCSDLRAYGRKSSASTWD